MEFKELSLSQVEVKFLDGQQGVTKFAGYGAVFSNVDAVNDIILPGAFADSIKAGGRMPRMHYNHDPRLVPGKWTALREDSKGLYMEGELTPGHSLANDLAASIRHGALDGLSIGFVIPTGGATKSAGIRHLSRIDLKEVSLTSVPANDLSRVNLDTVKSMLGQINTLSELEAFLRDAGGFSKSAATALVSRAKAILGDPEVPDPEPLALKSLLDTINSFKY